MHEPRDPMTIEQLESGLGDLGAAIAYPRPSSGFAGRVTARLEAATPAIAPPAVDEQQAPWWRRLVPDGRPLRRSVVLAVALLLILAVAAAAIGLGVPGIRILFAPPPTTRPVPTAAPPSGVSLEWLGTRVGLGEAVPFEDAERLAGLTARLPADPGFGRPDATFVNDGVITLVWASGPRLPPTWTPGMGLLITELRGAVERGLFEKQLAGDRTTVERVTVDGHPGYWITGEPHSLVYRARDGKIVAESRRTVGDALVWSDGEVTFRIETALGRDAALAIARGIP